MDMLTPVVLIVAFRMESDHLVLKYSVENKSGSEVYLVNRLTRHEKDKGWLPDPKVVYTKMDELGLIEIAKRVPREPENRLVTPRDFYVTPLADGEMFEEELKLPIPLVEHQPYDTLIEPIPDAREVDAVIKFSLGYFESMPTIEAKQVVVHGIHTYDMILRQPPATPENLSKTQSTPANSARSAVPVEKILTSELGKVRLLVIPLPKKR